MKLTKGELIKLGWENGISLVVRLCEEMDGYCGFLSSGDHIESDSPDCFEKITLKPGDTIKIIEHKDVDLIGLKITISSYKIEENYIFFMFDYKSLPPKELKDKYMKYLWSIARHRARHRDIPYVNNEDLYSYTPPQIEYGYRIPIEELEFEIINKIEDIIPNVSYSIKEPITRLYNRGICREYIEEIKQKYQI